VVKVICKQKTILQEKGGHRLPYLLSVNEIEGLIISNAKIVLFKNNFKLMLLKKVKCNSPNRFSYDYWQME